MAKTVKKTLQYAFRSTDGNIKAVDRSFVEMLLQEAAVIRRGRTIDGKCRIWALDIGGSIRIQYLTEAQLSYHR